MAESMSEQIFSIACALSKADESEKSMLRMESARAGGEEFSSLRAGDLTVTKCSSDEGSKRLSLLREQAWALMRPYTTDGGFCFRGVET